MVLDAALRVMSRNGYAALSVSEVLAEAGLSTRSFYRHFESKEAVVQAALDREVDAVVATLRRAVDGSGGPRQALEAWIDTMVDTFFDPRRAARSAAFTDSTPHRGELVATQVVEIRRRLAEPLAEVLAHGHRDGAFDSPSPDADAMSVFVLLATAASTPQPRLRTRKAVTDYVKRFAWPALGLDPTA